MFFWHVCLRGARRINHAAVAVGHKVYSFGGYCYRQSDMYNVGQNDVHCVFNTVSLRWTKLSPVITWGDCGLEVPSMCVGHTAVLIEDIIYIWGGLVNIEIEEVGYVYTIWGDTCNALYAFDVGAHKWFKPSISGSVPEARCDHSACVLEKVMYIFGGRQLTECINDIHKLDAATMVWSLINTRGTPATVSSNHSATIIGTKMFVFGGQADEDQIENNIRVFDTETDCWLSTPSADLLPEKREGHSAFAYNGELYIFGGYDFIKNRNINDLWKFNPETFSWKKVEPKGKALCWRSGMCCCMVGDCIILFGGYTHDPEDHLYILDLRPSLKMLCKLAVIEYGLEQSELPHDIRWELAAMKRKRKRKKKKKTARPVKRTEYTRTTASSLKGNV